jgi:hypothetical protein
MIRRPLGLALVAAFLLPPLAARAEEPPHLDFVRGLRERHYTDLALEYLQKLQQRKDLSPEVTARLPLELARTQLDKAADTPDLGDRLALFAEARKQFEDFLTKHPNSPLVNQARLDMADVAVRQGQTQLSRTIREEDPAAKAAEAGKARQLLDDAGKQLEAVIPLLEQQVKTYPEPKTAAEKAEKKELEDSVLKARIDVALNLFDQAKTYFDDGKDESTTARTKLSERALERLRKALPEDDTNPLYWVAQAWLGRLLIETGAPRDANKRFNEVIGRKEPYTAAGKRLARYFRLLDLQEAGDPNVKDVWKETKDEAGRWLKEYPSYKNTREGFGIRFLLAQSDLMVAGEQKTKNARVPLINEAKALCKDLEQVENDYQLKARRIKIDIIKEEGGLKGDLKTLTTFDDCYIRAQYEGVVLEKDEADGKKLTEAERKEHEKVLVAALEKSLELAKKQKVPESDLNNARAALAFTHMNNGDLQGAIRVGEELARVPTRPPQAGRAAIYALHSYAEIVADPEKKLTPEEMKDYHDRLRSLAEFAKKNWPNDAAGDVARHELGLLDIREGNYPAAVEDLSGIRPGYGAAILARYQMAMAALEAQKNGAKPLGNDKRTFEQRAQEALEKMPELPKGADPGTNYAYIMGKLRLGDMYYRAKKYDAMAAIADPLLPRVEELRFPEEKLKDEARTGLSTVSLLARYGKAEQDYAAGRFDAVIKALQPLLPEVDKLPALQTNPKLTWALFSLLMRSDIQTGKLDESQKVLDSLMALSEKNDLGGGTNGVLMQVAQLVKEQLREIEKKAPDKLPKTRDAFSKFLDKLTEQQEKKKVLSGDVLLILSNCYSALDNHKRAGDMLKAYPTPKDDAPQKDKEVWQVIQVMYLRELRVSKQKDEAKKKLEELLKTTWGPRNLEMQKEKLFLLMEDESWMPAAKGWDALVKALVAKITVPGMKDQYLECYYWLVYCLYQNAMKIPVPQKQAAALKQAATFITSLEGKFPDFGGDASKARFQDLLDKETKLKEVYEQLKGPKPAAPAGGPGNRNP